MRGFELVGAGLRGAVEEAIDRLPCNKVRFENGIGIFDFDAAIPDILRVHGYHRAVPALIETPCFINSDASPQSRLFHQFLEPGVNGDGISLSRTDRSRCANENVFFERRRHSPQSPKDAQLSRNLTMGNRRSESVALGMMSKGK